MMQVALAQTGVLLSDGSSNMPADKPPSRARTAWKHRTSTT